MVVPGRGFLLNNELTDFNFTTQGTAPDPNSPDAGKRPRSSMAPTIVFEHGRPVLALGSPGGSTIITTVLQILVNCVDLGRACRTRSPRRGPRSATREPTAEPAFIAQEGAALAALGHSFTPTPPRSARSTGHPLPAPRQAAGGRGADPPRRRATPWWCSGR